MYNSKPSCTEHFYYEVLYKVLEKFTLNDTIDTLIWIIMSLKSNLQMHKYLILVSKAEDYIKH